MSIAPPQWLTAMWGIVLVERMKLIGSKVEPHILWFETFVELNPYLVSAH